MKNTRIIGALICAVLLPGCVNSPPPDPATQLQTIQEFYGATVTALTLADDAGLIPVQWESDITLGETAADAAIKQMQANVASNPSQFQAAMNDFNAAMIALISYRRQVDVAPPATSQPVK